MDDPGPIRVTESDPVAPGETILRLIHASYFNQALPTPVKPLAFRPTDRDVDGLSVFREAFCTPKQALGAIGDPAKRSSYRIARIEVAELVRLGLSVRPMPIDSTPGHAVIPELSVSAYEADKVRCKEIQRALAEIASRSIVPMPSGAIGDGAGH